MTNFFLSALGVVVLFTGQRLFWLFVCVAGFAAGLQAAPLLLGPQPFWMVWGLGLVCGIFGAILAFFFQHVAIAVGGFLAGVYLSLHLLPITSGDVIALVSLGCGIAGAVALFLLFDWALIFLSAMIGTGLVIDSVGQPLPYELPIYIVLVAFGVAVQSRWLMTSRKRTP